VLYGGTAIARHLGHRASLDFDVFSAVSFAPDRLYASLPFLDGAQVLQSQPDTLTYLVDRGGPVQVSCSGTSKSPPNSPSRPYAQGKRIR